MSAVAPLDLSLDVGVDFFTVATLIAANGSLLGISGATAQVIVRATAADPPLFAISTTPSANGLLTFGVALPSPVGASVTNYAGLNQQQLPYTVTTVTPTPLLEQLTTLAALGAFNTTGLAEGTIAFVSAGLGQWFAWSPGDLNAPNGTTIIATTGGGPAGNWLLAGTVYLSITAFAAQLLAGLDRAVWDLVLTWSNGSTTKLLGGNVTITPTDTLGSPILPPAIPPVLLTQIVTASMSPYAVIGSAIPGYRALVFVDVTSGPVILNLPILGDVLVKNYKGSAFANNITVNAPPGYSLESPQVALSYSNTQKLLNDGQSVQWQLAGTQFGVT